MTAELPAAVRRTFDSHEAFTPAGADYAVETTVFEARVAASEADGSPGHDYRVTVEVPSLDDATTGHVGPAVQRGWFETMERRLADAPTATRAAVDLADFRLSDGEEGLTAVYRFAWDDPRRAAAIAKTFVEYVEGTYVESVIPGYDYEPPVGDLLARAAGRGGEASGGSTPL